MAAEQHSYNTSSTLPKDESRLRLKDHSSSIWVKFFDLFYVIVMRLFAIIIFIFLLTEF